MTKWTMEMAERYVRRVRDDLASGAITDAQFDMGTVADMDKTRCGSVGCIGGWMLMLETIDRTGRWPNGNDRIFLSELCEHLEDQKRGDGLHNLFFNYTPCPTREEAIVSIDKWLSGDNNPWGAPR